MKLNNFDKCIAILVVILVCIASITQYKNSKNITRNINELLQIRNKESTYEFPENYKTLSKEYNIYKDLYNNNDVILAFGYEDIPLKLHMGKDFHDDFIKRLKKENLDFKIITYKNYKDIKQEMIDKYGSRNEGCMMDNGLPEEYNSFLNDTEECLYNVCVIDNKKHQYTTIERDDMDYIIESLKNITQEKSN